MQRDTTYSYKGSEGFVIDNGVLIGPQGPSKIKHTSFGEYALERLRSAPDFVGQVDGSTGREENFALMTEKSVKCAMWLRERDIKPGDVIGICTHNLMDTYVPCLASLYVGAVINPWWNAGISTEVMKYFLTLTRPKMMFANEASARMIFQLAKEVEVPLKVIVLGSVKGLLSLDHVLQSQDDKIVADFTCTKLKSRDEPAVILYTSGSTGLPKGALHSHESLFGNVEIFDTMGHIEGTRISMKFSTIAWLTGLLITLRGVVRPETRIIHSDFSEEITFGLIENFKVNWMFLGTSPTVRMLKSPSLSRYDLSSLKYLYVGGSVLKEETQRAMAVTFPHTKVFQIYGMTEMGGLVLMQNDENPKKAGSSGRVVKNVMMKVINDTGMTLGPNQMGEACFKYSWMMTGYYNNPKATNEAIDAEGWMHSGDLAHYDEEGDVFMHARVKEVITYRGHRISPATVEDVILAHPEVSEVAVVATPHDVDYEHPIAFVARTPDAKVTKEQIENLVTDKLPDSMRLRGGIRFLVELPHTPSGKIARGELAHMAKSISEAS